MLVPRIGASRRMVGRAVAEGELASIFAMANGQGRPCVAVVTGEAGVGKTRLIGEFLASLGRETRVVASQARDGDVDRPFALIRGATEEHLSPSGDLPPPLERWHHPLAHLLEPLVRLPDHPDDGHTHVQEELARAGAAFVQHLLEPGPAVAVWEDLHWADRESLEVIERLARTDISALVLLSFRPEEFQRGHALGELLGELERQRPVSQIPLERLTRRQMAEFIEEVTGKPVSAAVVDRLHQRSDGNPFFVEELLAAVGARAVSIGHGPPPQIDLDALTAAPLPWSTAEAVLRRLKHFDDGTRELLRVAAALGDRFEFELLADLVDLPRDEVVSMLRTLVQYGIVAELPPSAFVFRHVLTWEATHQELLEAERRAVHERALEILIARESAPVASLAHHAIEAGQEARAAHFAREAAEQALHAGAPRSTLRLADLALEHQPDDVALHTLMAQAASQLGQLQRGAAHASRWLELAEKADDVEGQALAGCHLAWLRLWTDDPNGAQKALRAAMAASELLGPSPAQARVAATHARFQLAKKDFAGGVAQASNAITIAKQVGAPRAEAAAKAVKAACITDSPLHQVPEALEEAGSLIDEAVTIAGKHGDVEILATAIHNRLLPDRPNDVPIEQMWRWLDEALEIADRYGHERLAASLTILEAHVAIMAGQLDVAERAMASGRHHVDLAPSELAWRASQDAYLALEQDDVERAVQSRAGLRQDPAMLRDAEAQVELALIEASLAAYELDADTGRAAVERMRVAVPQTCPCVSANWWEIAVLALDAGVDPSEIRRRREQEAPTPFPRHAGLAAYAQGALAAADGDHLGAIDAFERSLDAGRFGRRAALLADTHARLGELLGAQGSRKAASEHVQAALELLERWPGRRRAAIEALHRRLGTAGGAPHELFTPRELEVVRLIVRGYTNSEIAERLFISRKTAATHVSNILSKTGFERRTQVATWAVQVLDERP